jgi:nucleotide-binding universal stress UspA family protein
MHNFRTILIAADFSERSHEAFRVACSLADETRTRMFVLHVVDQPIALGELGTPLPIPTASSHIALTERLRDTYAPSRPFDIGFRVRDGIAADEIVETAKNLGADLIVLGTHGRTGVLRLLTGSVAEAVLRRATCPVVALHAPNDRPTRVGSIDVILHPTDFSESSQAALQVARALARDHGARLHLLYVEPIDVMSGVALVAPHPSAIYYESLKGIQAKIDGPDLKYPVQIRAEQGDAQTEIVRVAEEIRADLIVLGSHGRTGLGRLFMGSVAEGVLRQAACPALVVKPTQHQTDRTPAEASQKTVTVF